MEDLSNIQTVIITPASQILPFAAVVGLISGTVSGVLAVAIRRWQSKPPMSPSILIGILLGYPLIGVLLLTVVALFIWNAAPTKSVAMLR